MHLAVIHVQTRPNLAPYFLFYSHVRADERLAPALHELDARKERIAEEAPPDRRLVPHELPRDGIDIMAPEVLFDLRNPVLGEHVIRIATRNDLVLCRIEPRIAGMHDPPPLFRNQADRKLLRNRRRGIGGMVIHDDHLVGYNGLREHALQTCPKVMLFVVCGDDKRELHTRVTRRGRKAAP